MACGLESRAAQGGEDKLFLKGVMNHLLAIVGPTAVGKSRLALRLAKTFGGEIVNADSRQFYRYMDIGTAKPGPEELSLVPHHLIDIVSPDDDFGLAQYQELAYRAIDSIHRRRRLPLLVGGSGQYVWSVLEGWRVFWVPPDRGFRRALEERAAEGGGDEIYRELKASDPEVAERIDRRNIRRVIRALELARDVQGKPAGLPLKLPPSFDSLIIGLTTDRAELHRIIDLRVDKMIEKGLVSEVKRLVSMGYGYDLPAMSAIGYRQIGMSLKGEMSLKTAIQQIKFEIHRFVRQQYNWFKLRDARIRWFDIKSQVEPEITSLVKEFIGRE